MLKKYLLSVLIGISVSFPAAAELITIDRYTLIAPQPKANELDPLQVNVQLVFPPNINTVKEAIKHVLLHSGWVLALDKSNDKALDLTLSRPLPQVHRKLSLMPLRTVLQVLVGQYYIPVEDPLRRIYTFDLKEQYRGLLGHD